MPKPSLGATVHLGEQEQTSGSTVDKQEDPNPKLDQCVWQQAAARSVLRVAVTSVFYKVFMRGSAWPPGAGDLLPGATGCA